MHVSDQDLSHYWMNCVVTYKGDPYRVIATQGGQFHLHPTITEGNIVVAPLGEVDTRIPPLGWIKNGQEWIYLYRIPARRVKKGYCQESIGAVNIHGTGVRFEYLRVAILQQLWKKPRKYPEILELPDGSKFYGTELVMDKGAEVEGKEKLSGYLRSLV